MLNIKEIALNVADSLRNKIDGISHMQSNQGLVVFAEALIAEIAKQNEPVARVNGYYSGHPVIMPLVKYVFPVGLALYTIPHTAEQIANETAEACARICDYKHNQPVELIEVAKTQSECAEALRNGAWKEFK